MPHFTPLPSGRPDHRGFTLIDLLVVVAVIALLVGILLPSLGQARKAAQRVGGASMQRQLFIGLSSYGSSNRFDIPGLNSMRQSFEVPASQENLDLNSFPLTPYDWISPSIAELPGPWEERAYHIFNEFADPALDATLTPDMVSGQPGYPIPELRELVARRGGMTAPSYQMPFAWQVNTPEELFHFRIQPLPRRIDRIAGASRKVAFADGTAHESNSASPGDFSILLECMNLGEDMVKNNGFLQFPPVHPSSEAYTPDSPLLDRFSYRQPGKTKNAMFWDGHCAQLTVTESLDPALWYPRGTEYLGGSWAELTEIYGVEAGDVID